MSTSQFWSVLALVATLISAICAAILPYFDALPPNLRLYGTIVAVVGAASGSVVMVLNQSLSPNHVSIPVERAIEMGIVKHPVTKETT